MVVSSQGLFVACSKIRLPPRLPWKSATILFTGLEVRMFPQNGSPSGPIMYKPLPNMLFTPYKVTLRVRYALPDTASTDSFISSKEFEEGCPNNAQIVSSFLCDWANSGTVKVLILKSRTLKIFTDLKTIR